MPDASPPLQLFIIYAREDQAALLELKSHLRPLEKRGDLRVWYDGEILPGEKWDDAIKAQLQAADIVLLFISKSFFNSEYIEKEELKKALARHQEGTATVIPVIVKPCAWDVDDDIAALQALPKDSKAVTLWGNVDEAWTDVVRGIMRIVKSLKASREVSLAMMDYLRFWANLQDFVGAIFSSDGDKALENYHHSIRTLESHATNDEAMTGGAFFILYSSYKAGEGVEKDFQKAIKYLFKSAEKGFVSAQFELGVIYENGAESIEPSINESIKWYRMATQQGSKEAKKSLKRLGYSE